MSVANPPITTHPRAEVAEEDVHRRGEERGMLRLEHEVVLLVRPEAFGQRPPLAPVLQAPLDHRRQVRPPAAEVVVRVDDRHPGLLARRLSSRQPVGRGDGVPEESVGLGKVERVDHVHEQEGDRARVRRVAV